MAEETTDGMAGGAAGTDRIDVDHLVAWVRAFAARVETERDHLTRLDSAIGDADHGSNMSRGMTAVVAKLDGGPDDGPPDDAGAMFKTVGMTLVSTVGGASGPLFGTFFLRLGTSLSGSSVTPAELVAALRAGAKGVADRGKAELGDKTMRDALEPAVDALASAVDDDAPLADGLAAAAAAARAGCESIVPLVARKGRASYLGERSAGHADPGATTVTLLFDTAPDALVG